MTSLSRPNLTTFGTRQTGLLAPAASAQPTFGLSGTQVADAAEAVTPSLKGYISELPTVSKLATKFVNVKDNGAANSGIAFLQDTATVWLPKSFLARSIVDLAEMSYLEFVESSLFYFSAPWVGGALKKAFKGIFPKGWRGVRLEHFEKPLYNVYSSTGKLAKQGLRETLSGEQLRRVTAAKAAMILASVGAVGMAAEYALSFGKNLLTKHIFKVEQFKNVANLSDHQGTNPEAMDKSNRRIKQSLGAAVGVLGLAGLIATTGHRSKLLSKGLDKFVKIFDFTYNTVTKKKTGKTINKFGLGRGQLTAIITAGMISYVDAARDKLERMEVGTRVALVGPYLASGGALFSMAALRLFRNKYKDDVIVQDLSHPHWAKAKYTTKELQAVFNETLGKELKKLGKTAEELTEQELKHVYQAVRNNKAMKGKLFMTWAPLLFGMATVGTGVTALMRFWTARRYKRQQAETATNTLPSQLTQQPQATPSLVPSLVQSPATQQTVQANPWQINPVPTSNTVSNILASSPFGTVQQKSFAEFTKYNALQ